MGVRSILRLVSRAGRGKSQARVAAMREAEVDKGAAACKGLAKSHRSLVLWKWCRRPVRWARNRVATSLRTPDSSVRKNIITSCSTVMPFCTRPQRDGRHGQTQGHGTVACFGLAGIRAQPGESLACIRCEAVPMERRIIRAADVPNRTACEVSEGGCLGEALRPVATQAQSLATLPSPETPRTVYPYNWAA